MCPFETDTANETDTPGAERSEAVPRDDPTRAAIAILARARAQCAALGVAPDELGNLLLDEAMLAWLMGERSERDVRKRLMEAMSEDVRKWYSRARVATGQCDCVQEVHLAGLLEAETMDREAGAVASFGAPLRLRPG